MSAASGAHDQKHVDLIHLHVLRALPPHDVARVEAQVATCTECQRELRALRPIVDAFFAWPTSVLRPAPSLWDRLALRIATENGTVPMPMSPPRVTPDDWKHVAPGIDVKILATDSENHRVSMLVRLAPGTAYPAHRHAAVEELHLLDGELWIDDRLLHSGDYNVGQPGAVDHRVFSETGCTCVLITSFRDELL